MSVFQVIKSLFQAKSPSQPAGPTAFDTPEGDIDAPITLFSPRLAEGFLSIEEESRKFLEHYGDFTTFFYRPCFDRFLRKEVLLFREPEGKNLAFLDEDHWARKHPFNFPGPFYSGESDTCGMGVEQAPENVMNDADCCEYVFKQPTSYYELLRVLDAAAVEVFDSYSSNGNEYWTYELCKNWWRNKEQLLNNLASAEVAEMNNGQAQLYIAYLNGPAETDLRRYCYFLENGQYPQENSIALPEL
ncbi:hypothetical protein IC235_10665 [Hymenobacter sp. BT664]|uniref:Uncharacterized protein n=1 Tax=Hymenobacter montanus TaxID=2771359 RepID=A0A927GJF4_9BACT|nr:hypothetical protein [Hymenobacter montanus]MBD2768355.1 hypothetical protein [Hymenobacter montanus]